MPPKKKSPNGDTAAGETHKFSWTPENDRTLLLLCLGRQVGTAEYEQFVGGLPAGASYQGVRQRISKLRTEQKAKYAELGWEFATEAGAKRKSNSNSKTNIKDKNKADATSAKRKVLSPAAEESDEEDKNAQKKKKKKTEGVGRKSGGGGGGGVKTEKKEEGENGDDDDDDDEGVEEAGMGNEEEEGEE